MGHDCSESPLPRTTACFRIRSSLPLALLAIVTAALVALPGVAIARASFEILPFTPALLFPPGDRLLSLSADGQTVVGQVRPSLGEPMVAAKWVAGEGLMPLDLPAPPPPFATPSGAAFGISADGSTIVGEAMNELGRLRAVVWNATDGSATVIGADLPGVLGGGTGELTDVSADGRVLLGMDEWSGFGVDDSLGAYVWDATSGARGIKAMTGYAGLLVGEAISDDGRVVAGLLDDRRDLGRQRARRDGGGLPVDRRGRHAGPGAGDLPGAGLPVHGHDP